MRRNGIKSPEQDMPCFRSFLKGNYACDHVCSYKTECECMSECETAIADKPLEEEEMVGADAIELVVSQAPDTIETEHRPAPGGISIGHLADVKKTVHKKQRDRANSRFDIIDIPDGEEDEK